MRELKFRAYIEINGKPLFTYSSDIGLIAFFRKFEYNKNIEQYTGLKDKNGEEIYEGDIVSSLTESIKGVKPTTDFYLKGVVKYCAEDTRYYIDGSLERSDREILEKVDLTDCDNFVGNYYELEVIGNIHENKELLKGEE